MSGMSDERSEEGIKRLAWGKLVKVQKQLICWTTLFPQKCVPGSARGSGNSRFKFLSAW